MTRGRAGLVCILRRYCLREVARLVSLLNAAQFFFAWLLAWKKEREREMTRPKRITSFACVEEGCAWCKHTDSPHHEN